jgi:hypothetical protein
MQRVDTQRLRIVVCGYIGLFPAGGAVWDYIQYPLGLRRLGHDVYYIEDTGNWPEYVPEGVAADGRYNIAHLERVMNEFGLGDRWAYLDPVSGNWFGMPTAKVDQVRRNADLLVSISCSAAMGADWSSIPVRAVIDSDPMFTQIQAQGGSGFTQGSRCGGTHTISLSVSAWACHVARYLTMASTGKLRGSRLCSTTGTVIQLQKATLSQQS